MALPFWKMAAGYLVVLAACAMVAITTLPTTQPVSLMSLPARRQALVYDSMTLGPYGSYDPQTWYFHDEAASSADGGFIYQVPQTTYTGKKDGRLLPYTWDEVEYQNYDPTAAAAGEEEVEEAPWGTMDDVVFQQPVSAQ
eukprot:CAMPEP_0181314502 /NCGR_PEP_ID=MMETSP1101-20121128/14854_1 /TAXON_ID=46948 /ORGANISM="Rhodomonas abbreviata, Strain Caron Lab Isolate" /LENGTH=139 /DNA_ID=CAMNT_0023421603 /DNA_START=6 /DNA_END=425 /DNA_ORIENTATION=+